MAVVPRKNKGKIVYRVAVFYQDKQYWEAAGSDRREAERLDARRKREVAEGRYVPPQARSGGITIKAYAERFFAARKNRNADSEQAQVERHALAIDWFAGLRLDDAKPQHFLRLVKELREKTKPVRGVERRALSEKSIANILGTIRTMFGDAHFNEVIAGNPYALPRKTLKRKSKARAPYNGREVFALLSDRVDVTRRVFLWLAFFTGMREGEICGRRWRDWVRDSRPLGALLCQSQYDDKPLKGDEEEGGDTRPRVIPVHPELAAKLDWWWREGWELVHSRRPTEDDFIFPSRSDASTSHTKSSAYKLWRKACVEAGVTNHSLHSTRHTFTTFARRGTPRTDAVEAITHNKRGEMVDYYNHWLWTPLCEAMLSLSYQADADEHHPLQLVKTKGGGGGNGAPTQSGSGAPPAPGAAGGIAVASSSPKVASCVEMAAASGGWDFVGPLFKKLPEALPRMSNQQDLGWRRRELNPAPFTTAQTPGPVHPPRSLPPATAPPPRAARAFQGGKRWFHRSSRTCRRRARSREAR
jgi:integrase